MAKLSLFVVSVLIVCQSATLAQSNWSLKKLIPAKKKSSPELLPSPEGNALFREKSSQPSPLQKMTGGTKSFLAKSKQMVPSWMLPKTQERTRKSTTAAKDSYGRLKQEMRVAQKKITAPWKRIGQSKAETDEPRTVNDFLAQPRP
jgi:hypothetical protein